MSRSAAQSVPAPNRLAESVRGLSGNVASAAQPSLGVQAPLYYSVRRSDRIGNATDTRHFDQEPSPYSGTIGALRVLRLHDKDGERSRLEDQDIPGNLEDFKGLARRDIESIFYWAQAVKARHQS